MSHDMFSTQDHDSIACKYKHVVDSTQNPNTVLDEAEVRDFYLALADNANWWQLVRIDQTDYFQRGKEETTAEALELLKTNMNLWDVGESFYAYAKRQKEVAPNKGASPPARSEAKAQVPWSEAQAPWPKPMPTGNQATSNGKGGPEKSGHPLLPQAAVFPKRANTGVQPLGARTHRAKDPAVLPRVEDLLAKKVTTRRGPRRLLRVEKSFVKIRLMLLTPTRHRSNPGRMVARVLTSYCP